MELIALVILALGLLFATLQYPDKMKKLWKWSGISILAGVGIILAVIGGDIALEGTNWHNFWGQVAFWVIVTSFFVMVLEKVPERASYWVAVCYLACLAIGVSGAIDYKYYEIGGKHHLFEIAYPAFLAPKPTKAQAKLPEGFTLDKPNDWVTPDAQEQNVFDQFDEPKKAALPPLPESATLDKPKEGPWNSFKPGLYPNSDSIRPMPVPQNQNFFAQFDTKSEPDQPVNPKVLAWAIKHKNDLAKPGRFELAKEAEKIAFDKGMAAGSHDYFVILDFVMGYSWPKCATLQLPYEQPCWQADGTKFMPGQNAHSDEYFAEAAAKHDSRSGAAEGKR